MTTTPKRQPDALKLADVLYEVASLFGFPSALLQSATELRRLHAENEALKAAQIDVKSAMLQAAAMEREACAMVCDELQDVPATEPRHCAADIRARGAP